MNYIISERTLSISLSLSLSLYLSLSSIYNTHLLSQQLHSRDLPTCPIKTTLICSFLGPRLSWTIVLMGAGSNSSSSSSSSSFIAASSAASASHFSVASVNKHTNQGLNGQVTNAYIRFVYDDKIWSFKYMYPFCLISLGNMIYINRITIILYWSYLTWR